MTEHKAMWTQDDWKVFWNNRRDYLKNQIFVEFCNDWLDYRTTEREEFREALRRRLLARVYEIVETTLTERQKTVVLHYYIENKTYKKAAEAMGVTYTAVANALMGMTPAGKRAGEKYKGKKHGGLLKKLRKICFKDDKCLQILDLLKKGVN